MSHPSNPSLTAAQRERRRRKHRKNSVRRRGDTLQQLIARYPKAFDPDNVRPLAIGTRERLEQELGSEDADLHPARVRNAVLGWVRSYRYLHAMKEGVWRVDLDGNPTDPVTAEQAQMAKNTLAQRKEPRNQDRSVDTPSKPVVDNPPASDPPPAPTRPILRARPHQ